MNPGLLLAVTLLLACTFMTYFVMHLVTRLFRVWLCPERS